MATRSASWSRSADLRAGAAALVAAVAFLGAWQVIHHGFYRRDEVDDTHHYETYGDRMAEGQVPYRDFGVEYPPGALPAFVLPALGNRGDHGAYRRVFEVLMAACGVAAVALTVLSLRALGAGPAWAAGALALVALFPLALGSVVLTRYDLWPAALTAAAVAALVVGRGRLASGVLGLAAAVKVYPVAIVPLAIAYVWKRRSRREALVCLGVLVAVATVCVAPFVALSPGGVWDAFAGQGSRPLQIESLASSLLLAAHQAFGLSITMRSSHGSQNLDGALPDTLALAQSVLLLGVLAALWVAFARGPAEPDRLVRYTAGVAAAFVALSKVLSPQFLIWLVPLVPLVRGARGLAASGLLAAALVVTQLWFPFRYLDLVLRFDPLASWLVLVRDLLLVTLLALLVAPGLRIRER